MEETIRIALQASKQLQALKICTPEDITSRKLAEAYLRYSKTQRVDLQQPAAKLVIEALSNAYPCSRQ